MESISPTPYSDVNAILNLLLTNVRSILQDEFLGMYLYGSLSSGDFNPETSDIDFLVVTRELLSDQKIAALEAMHNQIWASGMKWASRLEGSYVPQALIRRHDPHGPACPTVNEGRFYVDQRGSDWIIQRHVVREFSAIIAGPDPKILIDPVTPKAIRSAVRATLREWWFPMLVDSSWLKTHGSNYHGYAVITMCRALHAVEHGKIVSKPAAIQWAKVKLGEQWQSLIEQAVASQYGGQSDFLDETIEFIRFTREWTVKKKVGKIKRMENSRFKLISTHDLENYRDQAGDIAEASWPEFMLHDPIAEENWHELFDRFEEYQFALLDTETNRMAAMANSLPFYWDAPLEELPEGGWDWVFLKAIEDHQAGIQPNIQSAIQINIHPDYQGQGLSGMMVKAMRAIAEEKGFENLVAPVRPNQKSSYPLIPIDDYITWRNEEGMPFDAWLRVHARLGGRILKPCHQAMTIRGTRAEWEVWTGLKFPQSGEYHIPGALNPIEMDVEKNVGVYIEPNVWMVHRTR
jgi:GNAT superfamily N-acetyltransferase